MADGKEVRLPLEGQGDLDDGEADPLDPAFHAGIIAPGHSFAWGSPKAPAMLWKSLLGQETAIRMRLKPDLELYRWGLKFLRECTATRARHNTLVKLRLCQYSQAVMNALVRDEGGREETVLLAPSQEPHLREGDLVRLARRAGVAVIGAGYPGELAASLRR